MLISAVLGLTVQEPVTLPANLGRATHAWFLDQVRGVDPALAEGLHEPNEERPFTVSNLLGTGRFMQGDVSLSPGRPYFLRLTSCSSELSALLQEKILPSLPGASLELSHGRFSISGVILDGAAHPWAGQIAYAELVHKHTLRPSLPARQVTLHFASPTVFRSQGVNVPLPLPGLVFEGLLRRWNAFGPVRLPEELSRFADECLVISRYRLHTERVAFGETGERGAYPGFVGTCHYDIRVGDRYWMGLIHLLAEFAFYAGIGNRVVEGLGQARPLPIFSPSATGQPEGVD